MSKITKPWEAPLSPMIPYLAWGGLAPGSRDCWTTARHSNTCWELHIILQGTCKLAFDGQTHTMSPGHAVVIAPNVYHAPSDVCGPFCRFSLSFSADPDLMPGAEDPDRPDYLFFMPEEGILQLCRQILTELDAERFLRRELISAMFSQLMIRCLRTLRGENSQPREKTGAQNQEDEIERIDNFFAMYPPERQTRQELANYLHCSQRQLIRKMQALYAVSFRQKLIASRMDLARYLLRSTDKTVNEISAELGYADNAAFFRAFRRHTGMTPTGYRRESRERIE